MSVLSDNVETITDTITDTVSQGITNLKETWATRFKNANEKNRETLMNRIRASKNLANRRGIQTSETIDENGRRKKVLVTMSDQTATITSAVEAFAAEGHPKKSRTDSEPLGFEFGANRMHSEDYSLMVAPFANWCSGMKVNHKRRQSSLLPAACTEPQYSDDNSDFEEETDLQPRSIEQLTPAHRNAIRAIRRIKLLVARRKFKEALRPYDVKDVIEQYSAGHVDLLARVKSIQHRLDIVVGKTPMYAGKEPGHHDIKHSMANRLHKVEHQIDDIEGKLDILIEMVLEDRQSRHQIQDSESWRGSNENSINLPNGPTNPQLPKSPSIPSNLKAQKKLSIASELLMKRKASLSASAVALPILDDNLQEGIIRKLCQILEHLHLSKFRRKGGKNLILSATQGSGTRAGFLCSCQKPVFTSFFDENLDS